MDHQTLDSEPATIPKGPCSWSVACVFVHFLFCKASWVRGHDTFHLELSGFAWLHGWGRHDTVNLEFSSFAGLHAFGGGEWNMVLRKLQVLQGCVCGGEHDTVHLEFSIFAGLHVWIGGGGRSIPAFINSFCVYKLLRYKLLRRGGGNCLMLQESPSPPPFPRTSTPSPPREATLTFAQGVAHRILRCLRVSPMSNTPYIYICISLRMVF